jgi:hypothetical protein
MKYLFFIFLIVASCGSNESSPKGDDSSTPATPTPLTDEQLVDAVEKQTFKYFWDFAEPNSKLARERYHPDGNYPENDSNIVTTGGSGFGLMSIIAATSRNYVSRSEAVSRLNTIADFLASADRFHGAWPHWMDGTTGRVKPFGQKDNGGDLVETAFLCQGMICVREFFKDGTRRRKSPGTEIRQFMERC